MIYFQKKIYLQKCYICQVTQAFNKFDTSGDNRCVLGTSTILVLFPGMFEFLYNSASNIWLKLILYFLVFKNFIVVFWQTLLWTPNFLFFLSFFLRLSIILTNNLLNLKGIIWQLNKCNCFCRFYSSL